MKIKLGSKVKDRVSGFTGIVESRIEYLNGCIQYGVVPKVGKDNKKGESLWVDEEQIEIIGKGVTTESKPSGGGFREHPIH